MQGQSCARGYMEGLMSFATHKSHSINLKVLKQVNEPSSQTSPSAKRHIIIFYRVINSYIGLRNISIITPDAH